MVIKLERMMKYPLQTYHTHLSYGSKGSDIVLGAYYDASFGPTLKTDTKLHLSYEWVYKILCSSAKSFDSRLLVTKTSRSLEDKYTADKI